MQPRAKRLRRRCLAAFTLCTAVWLVSASPATGYGTATHRELNVLAAELVARADLAGVAAGGLPHREVYEPRFERQLGAGGVAEDSPLDAADGAPPGLCQLLRVTQHFFHPFTGLGLEIDGQRCISALQWARDSDGQTWTAAIEAYDYSAKQKKLAYEYLGHVAHLVGDMAQPQHVHLLEHGPFSSRSGYEQWVKDNWALVEPSVSALTPRRRPTLEDHLRDMAMATYMESSLQGGALAESNPPLAPGSQLATMFDVTWKRQTRQWVLRSPYSPKQWTWSAPRDDDDGWWPTSSDGDPRQGYYYLEALTKAIPASFGGQQNTAAQPLAFFYARDLLALSVEYTAGLYEYFSELVNHPPIVRRVRARQANRSCAYARRWHDELDDDDARVQSRTLVDETACDAHFDASAETSIRVDFGDDERMRAVDVSLGDQQLTGGTLVDDGASWQWRGTIESCDGTLKIRGSDSDAHDLARSPGGASLDGDPSSPAKVSAIAPHDWAGDSYTPGADVNHTLKIDCETLRLTKTGTGDVTATPGRLDCGARCEQAYPHGLTVELRATPAADFLGWSGDCGAPDPASPTTSVTMDGLRDCGARFASAGGIHGYVWIDYNGDGLMNGDAYGNVDFLLKHDACPDGFGSCSIPPTITLYRVEDGGGVDPVATTEGNLDTAQYEFTDVDPGTYVLHLRVHGGYGGFCWGSTTVVAREISELWLAPCEG